MIDIRTQVIELEAVCKTVRADGFGAVVVFEGVVRAQGARGEALRELYYETYRELALAEMERIAGEVQERWMPCAITMVHRVGVLHVGECSVVVAVGSAHRPQAFDACAYAIDQLKSRIAIWKQERYADGSVRWLEEPLPSPVRS